MKCITVAQPFAWAVVSGQEQVVYRCHGTDFRGNLLIRAGLPEDAWLRTQLALYGPGAPRWEELPRGLVVGLAELYACEPGAQGEWAWRVRDPRPLPPFRVPEGKGIFDVRTRGLRLPSERRRRGGEAAG